MAKLLWGVILGYVLACCVFLGARAYESPCIPGNAIDYRGDLDAWVDRQGKVVLLADAEDMYDFCTKP